MARKIKAQALTITTDGDDVLIGSHGSDTLNGGDGNDTLWGYNNWGVSDVLIGGSGSDTFLFNHPGESLNVDGARDQIADFTSGEDKISLASEYMTQITFADISITDMGGGAFRVGVDFHYDGNDVIPDPWMAVDVVSTTGVAPVESDFVFA